MAGHAQTNCFLRFTFNQSLPQVGTPGEQQGGGRTGLDATGLRGLAAPPSFMLKSFLSWKKQTTPFCAFPLAYCLLKNRLSSWAPFSLSLPSCTITSTVP